MTRRLPLLAALACLAGCAPPGYHYEVGSFTPTPKAQTPTPVTATTNPLAEMAADAKPELPTDAVDCLLPGVPLENAPKTRAECSQAIAEASPPTPAAVQAYDAELAERCKAEGGSFDLCMLNGKNQYTACQGLKEHAYSTMLALRNSMAVTHGTAQQVVQGDVAGLADWQPGGVSYANASAILQWAVQEANTMFPYQFAKAVYDRCMQAQ
jgi:hypothetical protein